jgi:hypothetical protein
VTTNAVIQKSNQIINNDTMRKRKTGLGVANYATTLRTNTLHFSSNRAEKCFYILKTGLHISIEIFIVHHFTFVDGLKKKKRSRSA